MERYSRLAMPREPTTQMRFAAGPDRTCALGSFTDGGARSTSRRAQPGEPSVAWAGQVSGPPDVGGSTHWNTPERGD